MILKYKRTMVFGSVLAVLFAGSIALMGCSGTVAPNEAMPQAALNPDSTLPALVWSGDKPQLPAFTAWEYMVQPGPPMDAEELLARIWEGKEIRVLRPWRVWDVLPSSALSEQIWKIS